MLHREKEWASVQACISGLFRKIKENFRRSGARDRVETVAGIIIIKKFKKSSQISKEYLYFLEKYCILREKKGFRLPVRRPGNMRKYRKLIGITRIRADLSELFRL